ncbi:hypothetical protein H6F76_02295 [Leptolyngbya sp. FACHB-321]|uniref:hypothetical protein n=1 Tax=Leptolyngbya sp. FACHB-321 TaxID=2692807 RepID=UPI0016820CE6|nr:hypothetical protein [Leptolyngbya sp. FACHB-321]MBD2033883.1 hypothetical protein [Leptolyngbya sp. FACHB-321]
MKTETHGIGAAAAAAITATGGRVPFATVGSPISSVHPCLSLIFSFFAAIDGFLSK